MDKLDLDKMRRSGRILAETLEYVCFSFVRAGISALDISLKAEEVIRSYEGAIPAFLGYNGFPAAACVSVNNEVVHSIPLSTKILKEGDIVSIDCGVIYEEHFSDACRTVGVGNIDFRCKKLIKVAREALDKGIEASLVGNHIGDISYAIQKHVERKGLTVSLDYTGHGIGKQLHAPPCVPNYGPPGKGPRLEAGTCLAIEPVIFDGPTDVWLKDDRWTVYSREGNLSAHVEDTVIITDTGPEIITRL